MQRHSNDMLLNHLAHFSLLCICLFLPGCNMYDDPSAEKEKMLITKISEARAKAFNKGNAAAIAVHFTEDALLMAPGKPAARGRVAVQSYYQSIFDQYSTQLESRYEEVEVSCNLAYGRGFAKVTLIPKKGGEPVISTAKYLNILKKQPDGSWKTTHDIWNGNEQP